MIIDIYHNIRWSRYKARVFSALHRQGIATGVDIRFTQIADTSDDRTTLSGVELGFHQYPHQLLFPGSYDLVPKWKLASTLFSHVMRAESDLVLIPGYDQLEYWSMLAAAILTNKKRGVFCDSTLLDRKQLWIKSIFKRLFFHFCDIFFGYGIRSRELLMHYGANPNFIFQRCQAAALPDAYDINNVRELRLRSAPSSNAPRFLYVGRLSQEKGIETLIYAFAKVYIEIRNANLVLVGGGPLMNKLKSLAFSLGIETAVEFAGSANQETLASYYTHATCLILPSYSEPWGLVVNEALHYGCPVVVSDRCGCVPELVHDSVTGYTFRAGDENDLSDKLLRLVDEFTDLTQVTNRCLDVISIYTPDAAAEQILNGCRHILSPNFT